MHDDLLVVDGPVDAVDLWVKWQAKMGTQKSILVTDELLADNWFSHEYRDCAIITIGDWEQHCAPPSLRSYLIY